MKMLVLAGGFGTRLRSAVADVPKPLAPIGSVPFLYFQIESWVAQGVRSFVFLLHHQAELVIDFLKLHNDGLLAGCDVKWCVENVPLDTGGAVAHAVQEFGLSGEFLVTNADTWLGDGVRPLVQAGANSMAVIHQSDASRYGQIEMDGFGMVVAFREKSESAGQGWINAGMCLLKADCFDFWRGQRLSLERDLFPQLVESCQLKAVILRTDFLDIGMPEDYAKFCRWHGTGCEGKLCN